MPEPKIYGVGDVDDAAVETLRTRFMERIQKDDLKGEFALESCYRHGLIE